MVGVLNATIDMGSSLGLGYLLPLNNIVVQHSQLGHYSLAKPTKLIQNLFTFGDHKHLSLSVTWEKLNQMLFLDQFAKPKVTRAVWGILFCRPSLKFPQFWYHLVKSIHEYYQICSSRFEVTPKIKSMNHNISLHFPYQSF